jgi:hypothetical protein
MQVFLSYPSWFVLLCVALASIYSIILYYKQKQLASIQKTYRYLLSIARFVAVFIISFLLLAPFVKRHSSKTEKPIIIIAQDNSSSIKYAFKKIDSNAYFKNLNTLQKELSENYEVKTYTFDEQLHPNYSKTLNGKISNLSKTLDDINDIYFNRNVGAIIMATDGIYNRGISPQYTEASNLYPIYTVVLGDTTPQKDAKISQVLSNDIVYLGDKFEVKADISSFNCKNQNATIYIEQIIGKGKSIKVNSSNIGYTEVLEQKTISYILNASTPGMQHYRITHSAISGEYTLENNSKDIYVQVLDGRDKILIVADGPHPDISALKQAIEKNKNYTLDIKYANEPISKLEEFNVAILHQLPSASNASSQLIGSLKQKNISTWYILGANSSTSRISESTGILEIKSLRNSFNDANALINPEFSLFTIDENYMKTIEKLPPLTVPYGDYKATSTNTLLHQKIGSVATKYPMWVLGETQLQKQAYLMGEGLWRWRMFNYVQTQNYDAVDDLILKTIQYLSVKGDKRKFKSLLSKNVFNENENVLISAQLYNDNYQLINSCDVNLTLIDENEKKYTYTFSKENTAYSLDLGKLHTGVYTYEASTNCNGKSYKDLGKFTVKALQLEAQQITADDDMLFALSQKKNAQMVYANDLLSLSKMIKAQKDIKPIIYDSYKTDSIINLKIIFFILLFLLAFEWILRKYLGIY